MDALQTGLALPMAGMMTLTLLVWVYMFVQRISYMTANQVDADEMVTPADVQAGPSAHVLTEVVYVQSGFGLGDAHRRDRVDDPDRR